MCPRLLKTHNQYTRPTSCSLEGLFWDDRKHHKWPKKLFRQEYAIFWSLSVRVLRWRRSKKNKNKFIDTEDRLLVTRGSEVGAGSTPWWEMVPDFWRWALCSVYRCQITTLYTWTSYNGLDQFYLNSREKLRDQSSLERSLKCSFYVPIRRKMKVIDTFAES